MNTVSDERVLIQGPCLKDLTDLLCFDKIVYPTTMLFKRPRTFHPSYMGYPIDDYLPQSVRDKLGEAGFLIAPGTFIFDFQRSGSPEPNSESQNNFLEAARVMGEVAFSFLATPATEAEEAAWFCDIDTKTKAFADISVNMGKRAIPKYYAADITKTLKPGWNLAMSVVFPEFPSIEWSQINIDNFIAFLADENTKTHRQNLFNWIRDFEKSVQQEGIHIEEVYSHALELLSSYSNWILSSGLSRGLSIVEFLFVFSRKFIEQMTTNERFKDTKIPLILNARGLSLIQKDNKIPGRELAYISHYKRVYPEPSLLLLPITRE